MLIKGVAKYDSRAEDNIITSLYSLLRHEGDELVGSSIIIIVHGEHVKEAVKIFQSITQNDKAAMFNTHGNLDENLVMEQFEKIRERYNRPTTVISIKDSKEVTANDDTEDIPYLEAEEV